MTWMPVALTLALLVFLGLGLVAGGASRRRFRAELQWRRERALADIHTYRVSAPDERFAFDGQTATVVYEHERLHNPRANPDEYSLTCYLTNEAGEYFMFIADGVSKPFFKHVEPRIARVVLKDRFREPCGV